jgi:hypothetical protein
MEQPSPAQRRKAIRIGLLTIIIIPLVLIGGYYLWSFYIMRQFAVSLTETIKTSHDQKVNARRKEDIELLYIGLLKQAQACTFTGQNTINDTTYTAALQIKALDSFSVSYRIEYLINWKQEKDRTGIAKLDASWLGCQTCYFKDETGKPRLAFRFLDKKVDCTVELLISKDEPLFQSIAMAKEICNGNVQLEIKPLNYK